MNTIRYISLFLKKSIANNDKAILLLAGGNSTKSTYNILSKKNLEWEKVETFLVDERLVDKTDSNSNYKLISKNFKKNYSKKIKINFLCKASVNKKKLKKFIKSNGPSFLEVKIKEGTIDNLGRPKNFIDIKNNFKK